MSQTKESIESLENIAFKIKVKRVTSEHTFYEINKTTYEHGDNLIYGSLESKVLEVIESDSFNNNFLYVTKCGSKKLMMKNKNNKTFTCKEVQFSNDQSLMVSQNNLEPAEPPFNELISLISIFTKSISAKKHMTDKNISLQHLFKDLNADEFDGSPNFPMNKLLRVYLHRDIDWQNIFVTLLSPSNNSKLMELENLMKEQSGNFTILEKKLLRIGNKCIVKCESTYYRAQLQRTISTSCDYLYRFVLIDYGLYFTTPVQDWYNAPIFVMPEVYMQFLPSQAIHCTVSHNLLDKQLPAKEQFQNYGKKSNLFVYPYKINENTLKNLNINSYSVILYATNNNSDSQIFM